MTAPVSDDVAAYARARWNDLVRTGLALGASTTEAEQAARTTLARCQPSWRRVRRHDDVDVHVYGTLLDELDRQQNHGEDAAPPEVLGTAEQVLSYGAGLDDHQVDRVVGADGLPVDLDHGDLRASARIGEQWNDLYRGTAPVAEIGADVRRARLRRLVVGVAVVAVLALAAGVVRLVQHDSAPDHRQDESRNPVGLAWWADDVLHLGRTTVEAPGLRSLAQGGSGTSYAAVYGDPAGTVVQADADGTTRPIGRETPGARIVGSRQGLVAWVDPRPGRVQVVVWNTSSHAVARTIPLDISAGIQPLAIDDGDLYLSTPDGVVEYAAGGGPATDVPGRVLDVAGQVPLLGAGPESGITLSTSTYRIVPGGQRAVLSADGTLGVAWTLDQPGALLLRPFYDNTTPPPLVLPPEDIVLDARFTSDDQLVVLVSQVRRLSIGSATLGNQSGRAPLADLLTCNPQTGACRVSLARVTYAASGDAAPVVLAD